MNSKHDDVAAVAAIAGIDLHYKTFSPAPLRPSAHIQRAPNQVEETPQASLSLPVAPKLRVRRSIFDDRATVPGTGENAKSDWATHLPAASLAVSALSGGAGVTTIQATLGRILAERGCSALLVERSKDGFLPHYFGARTSGWGRSLFQPQEPGRQAPIAVLSGGRGADSIAEPDIWRMVESHRGSVDCVLIEEWAEPSDASRAIWNSEAIRLVVLVPDPQTAIRLRRWTEDGALPGGTFFLLNKFDSAVPLHREMRAWLSGRLGTRLLNTTIRRSDTIADAMAEGMTLVEFAPTAPVTHDFLQLADWFQAQAGTAK